MWVDEREHTRGVVSAVSDTQVRKSKITKHFLVWLGMGRYTVETFSNKYFRPYSQHFHVLFILAYI